jgi:ubiquitin carboxyl-terminal hydrolase 5/13
MACEHLSTCLKTPPRLPPQLYKEECVQCFTDTSASLLLCLACFDTFCQAHASAHRRFHSPLYAHIQHLPNTPVEAKSPKRDKSPPRKKQSVESEWLVEWQCLQCQKSVAAPDAWSQSLLGTLSSTEQSVLGDWSTPINPCEHTLCLEQFSSPLPPAQVCTDCDQRSNLWLCMTCGNVGCGRKQFDGSGGNNHGIDHFTQTQHPVAVKLGTITADGKADVYCYPCDDMKQDPELVAHLAVLGLSIDGAQKTEKSMAELQLEQNMNFEFSMATDDGLALEPIFGPRLTGLKNIGNSCYMASVMQSLLVLPELNAFHDAETHYKSCTNPQPSTCLLCQMYRLVSGMNGGRYSIPDKNPKSDIDMLPVEIRDQVKQEREKRDTMSVKPWQAGLSPFLLKQLVGKNHAEFATARQQDAYEYLQYMLDMLDTVLSQPKIGSKFEFMLDMRVECTQCHSVSYREEKSAGLSLPVPAQALPRQQPQDDVEYKDVTMKQCLDTYGQAEAIEGFRCSGCHKNVTAMKRTRFKTFPSVLVMHMRRFVLENWVPKKLNVTISVGSEQLDLTYLEAPARDPNEKLMPDDDGDVTAKPDVDMAQVEQLKQMGFSENRSIRALLQTGRDGMVSVEAAMEWLFSKMDDPSLDMPLSPSTKKGPHTMPVDESMVSMIMDMGFSRDQARLGLKKEKNNVERAIEWLFNNPGAQFEPEVPAASSSSDQVGGKIPRYQLMAIVAHKGRHVNAGHYVCYVKYMHEPTPELKRQGVNRGDWILFNDEKVVKFVKGVVGTDKDVGSGYLYFWHAVT